MMISIKNSDFLGKPCYKTHARYFRTFGEKEHTSKRVSIIASDNAISKAKQSGTPKDTFVLLGKRSTRAKE